MSLATETPRARWQERLPIPDLREPLLRNGLALSLSAVLSSGIGFVFWLIAAHRYPPAVVGEDSVAISALQLVGGIAQLNLANGMIRFIPGAGVHRRRFVLGSYGVSALVALMLGLGFVALSRWLGGGVHAMLSNPLIAAAWVGSCIAWSIFVLEDGALTGLRHARWVPIENAGHGILKAVLIIPLALLAPKSGILLAWGFATVATIVVTNVFLLGRAVPSEQRRAPVGQLDLGELRRYLPYDYLASLCWLACTSLLPLFVIHRAGARASAFYALAWVVTQVMYLVSISLGSSFVVEAVANPTDLWQRCRQVLGHLMRLLVPAVAIVVVGAPVILRLFGAAYAEAGTTTLRLMALSALPFAVTSTAISSLRVLRRTKVVFALNAVLGLLVGGGTWFALPRYGILAAGISWLGGQVLVASAVMLFFALRTNEAIRGRALAASASVALAGARAASAAKVAGPARQAVSLWRRRHQRQATETISSGLLADFAVVAPASAAKVAHLDVVSGASDLLVVCARSAEDSMLAILKVPGTAPGRRDLLRQGDLLSALSMDDRLKSWSRLTPGYRLVYGEHVPLFAIETPMAGVSGQRLFSDNRSLMLPATRLAFQAIGEFHDSTSMTVHLDAAAVRELLDPMVSPLRAAHPSGRVPRVQYDAISRLEDRLGQALEGRDVTLGWVHGDFTPPNVLFDLEPVRVAAIVDWGQASQLGVPALDLLSWVFSVARVQQRAELGVVLRRIFSEQPVTSTLGLASQAIARSGIPFRELTLLYWLSHITSNLEKSARRYLRNPLWWAGVVEPMLEVAKGLP
ncbi:MAG: aminoglycoside phosphotransferase family protein [Acidimicrobiaceae bacterium]|nr:aminoglycoside phosphotransferase family protein [Acidimicrobiaceae bacterium]